jgi:hypothetical protein
MSVRLKNRLTALYFGALGAGAAAGATWLGYTLSSMVV